MQGAEERVQGKKKKDWLNKTTADLNHSGLSRSSSHNAVGETRDGNWVFSWRNGMIGKEGTMTRPRGTKIASRYTGWAITNLKQISKFQYSGDLKVALEIRTPMNVLQCHESWYRQSVLLATRYGKNHVPDFVENLTGQFGLLTTAIDKGETEKIRNKWRGRKKGD